MSATTRGTQPTYRIADLSNPNLKPWVKERMKKDNDEVLAGKIAFTPRSSCMPAGVPAFMAFIVEPVFFVQSPKEVLIIYSGDQQVRRVYLDVPHSANPKPSWYGESVGHYDGDTLVIDTIGLNDKTFVDNYRTPHTEKLHVVERWQLIDDGKTLEVKFTLKDVDTYFISPGRRSSVTGACSERWTNKPVPRTTPSICSTTTCRLPKKPDF